MTTIPVFAEGLLLGLSIAAPVGPIGLLCIRRSLADGMPAGFATGLGAATADASYGAIAAFGLASVTGALVRYADLLRLFGGVFLIWLGVAAFRSAGRPRRIAAAANTRSLATAYVTTVGLTLTNPATILSFIAAFGALGLATTGSGFQGAAVLVLGVFLGSAAWWLLLSTAVSTLRAAVTPRIMGWIDRASGTILTAFGLGALAALVI